MPTRALALAAALLPAGAGAAPARPGAQTVPLQDDAVEESSGLVASLAQPSILWTIDDAGNDPIRYATDETGAARGRWRATGAENVDWEDLAVGFAADGTPLLIVADMGDNDADRDDLALYLVPEPAVPDAATGLDPQPTLPTERVPFAYPDGPTDAEALLRHPTTGETLIVAKGEDRPSVVYRFPTGVPAGGDPITLKRIGTLRRAVWERLGRITGGAVSADGRRMALIARGGVVAWEIAPGETLVAAMTRPARRVEAPLLDQQEAIAYAADGSARYLTAEASPAPLARVSLDD